MALPSDSQGGVNSLFRNTMERLHKPALNCVKTGGAMLKKSIAVTACFVLLFLMPSRIVTGQDAKSLVQAASKAMGIENVNSVMFYGSGANFNLGQSNRANGPWPRTNLNDYTR